MFRTGTFACGSCFHFELWSRLFHIKVVNINATIWSKSQSSQRSDCQLPFKLMARLLYVWASFRFRCDTNAREEFVPCHFPSVSYQIGPLFRDGWSSATAGPVLLSPVSGRRQSLFTGKNLTDTSDFHGTLSCHSMCLCVSTLSRVSLRSLALANLWQFE